jgi:hypothetical protein
MTKTTLHAAMVTSTALEFSGLLILAVTPETLTRTSGTEWQPRENSTRSIQPAANFNEPTSIRTAQTTRQWTRDRLHRTRDRLMQPVRLLWTDKTILLGLPAFLTSRLLRQVVYLLLQYASKKLNRTIAAVSCLSSFDTIVFWSPSCPLSYDLYFPVMNSLAFSPMLKNTMF